MVAWPEWWSWEVELCRHILGRMEDRQFNEVDLRLMLEEASGYHAHRHPGRYVIGTRHAGRAWEVIVEPEPGEKVLVVVTAYPVEREG